MLPRLRGGAAARKQPASQSGVVQDASGPGLEPTATSGFPRGSSSRNGRDLAGSAGRFDSGLAVELHAGAGARRAECWRWNRTHRWRSTPRRPRSARPRDQRRGLRTLRASAQWASAAKRVESAMAAPQNERGNSLGVELTADDAANGTLAARPSSRTPRASSPASSDDRQLHHAELVVIEGSPLTATRRQPTRLIDPTAFDRVAASPASALARDRFTSSFRCGEN